MAEVGELFLSQSDFKTPQLVRQEAQVAFGRENGPRVRNFLTQEELDQDENAVWKVLDVLSRGEYVSANMARWIMGNEDLDPFGAALGHRKTTYFDIADDLGLDGGLKWVVGLGGGVGLDPVTYTGIGALGKVGRTAEKVGSLIKGGAKFEDLAKLNTRLGKEIRFMTNNGLDIKRVDQIKGGLGEALDAEGRLIREGTLLAQAQKKQRFALSFMGVGITPDFINEPAMKYLGKGADFILESGTGKWMRGIFSADTGIRELDNARRKANDLKRARASAALQAVEPVWQIFKKLPQDLHENVAQLLQRQKGKKVKTAPLFKLLRDRGNLSAEDARTLIDGSVKAMDDLWEFEKLKGITDATKIEGDLEYYPMIMEDGFKDWYRTTFGNDSLPKNIRKWSHRHVSMFERNFQNLSTIEVDIKRKAGQLVINGKKVPKDLRVFSSDLPKVLAVRYLRAARSATAVDYLSEVSNAFGKRPPVRVLENGVFKEFRNPDNVPPNWVGVKNTFINSTGDVNKSPLVFPPEVAKQIDEVFDRLVNSDEINKFGDWYSRAQGVWKANTLAIFPAYHFRNYVGNAWQYFLSGAWKDPKSLLEGMQISLANTKIAGAKRGRFGGHTNPFDTTRMGKTIGDDWRVKLGDGREFDKNQFAQSAKDRGMFGGIFTAENESRVTNAVKTSKRNWQKANPLSADFSPYQWGFEGGAALVEDPWRIGLYLHNLKKGLSEDAAALDVKKWFYDYFDLSKVERELFRNLMPFYAWLRKNIPTQIEQIVRQPGKFTIPLKAKKGAERDQIMMNPQFMPEWMKASMPIQTRRDKDGNYEYMILKSWLPAADIADIFDPVGMFSDALSPLLKEPYQQFRNFDSRYERQIQKFPGEASQFLGMPMDTRLTHFLRNIRLLTVGDKLLREGDASLQAKSSGLHGLRVFPVDPEKQQFFQQLKASRELSTINREQARNMQKWMLGEKPEQALINISALERAKLKKERELQKIQGPRDIIGALPAR